MKLYNCDHCGQQVYFENTMCVGCGTPLGYLPVLDNMSSIVHVDGTLWKAITVQANSALYKKCQNYHAADVCNWMIPQNNDNEFCLSCSLNETIPDLGIHENKEYWHRLEIAKRRLVYSLLRLNLPVRNKKEDPENGLAFAFLADKPGSFDDEEKRVMTGHDQGKITINIAEANDAIKEKIRLDMNERYRTLLGHFRHEIGHYFWSLIIEKNAALLTTYRALFGDEQQDYGKALKNYYQNGAPQDWQQHFISAYASSHPWEDWAESFAHFLHMFDTLETASAWGWTVNIKRGRELKLVHLGKNIQTFDEMHNQWVYLSTSLNSLNRSMGMKDVYPFVWSNAVVAKLHFIQEVVSQFKGEKKL